MNKAFKLLNVDIKNNKKLTIGIATGLVLMLVLLVYNFLTPILHRYTTDNIANADNVVKVSTNGAVSIQFIALSNELHSFTLDLSDINEDTCFNIYYCIFDPEKNSVIKMENMDNIVISGNGQLVFDFKYNPFNPMMLRKGKTYSLNMQLYKISGQDEIGLFSTGDIEGHAISSFYVDGVLQNGVMCTELNFDDHIGRLIEISVLLIILILLAVFSVSATTEKRKDVLIDALSSAFLVYLLFYAASKLTFMGYHSSDDISIQSTLSGASTGGFYPYHVFISTIIGYPIAKLYQFFPGIRWWYVYSQCVQLTGLFLVHFCCLRMASGTGKKRLPIILGLMVVDIVMGINIVGGVAFTIVPAVLGTGLIAVNISWSNKVVKIPKWALFVINMVGFILCEAHRISAAKVIMVFWACSVCYVLLKTDLIQTKRIIIFVLALAFGFLSIKAVSDYNKNVNISINGKEFATFNTSRSDWIDYPHKDYDEAPEFFEEVGWSRSEALMALKWFFIGEHVNADSLRKLAQLNREGRMMDKFTEHLHLLWEDIGDYNNIKILALLIIFAVISLTGIQSENLKTPENLMKYMSILLSFAMTAYLIYMGRPLYRTVWISVFPGIIMLFLLSQKSESFKEARLYGCILMAVLMWTMPGEFMNSDIEKHKKDVEFSETVRDYMSDHPENVYINGGIGAVSGESVDEYVKNYINIRTATYGSAEMKRQLRINGLESDKGDIFLKDNVRLLYMLQIIDKDHGWNEYEVFEALYSYLEQNYGCTGWEIEDEVTEGVYVYRFLFDKT